MTVFNEKEDRLHIIIKNPLPHKERDNISKALCAAIRWNGISATEKVNGEDVDLIRLSDLMEGLISSEIFYKKNEEYLKITLRSVSPEEDREDIINALCAAIRWYCTDPDFLRDVDGEHLTTISRLIENMIQVKVLRYKE